MNDSLFIKVGKTVSGKRISDEEFKLTIDNVIENLCLNSNDNVLDICCGTGLILNNIQPYINSGTGIDLSSEFINLANTYKGKNVNYFHGIDVKKLASYQEINLSLFNKFMIHSAIQYFDMNEIKTLIQLILEKRKGDCAIYLVDVPDKDKFFDFYNTAEKLNQRAIRLEKKQEEFLHWYTKDDFLDLEKTLNCRIKIIEQHPGLRSSCYFRFNVMISGKGPM